MYKEEEHSSSRYQAAEAIFRSGMYGEEDVAAFEEMALEAGFSTDYALDRELCYRAIKRLDSLGRHRVAIGVLEKQLEDVSGLVDSRFGTGIREVLEVMGSLSALKDVGSKTVVKFLEVLDDPDKIRELSLLMAGQERLRDPTIAALGRMVKDDGVDEWIRCEAALALAVLGKTRPSRWLLVHMEKWGLDSYARDYLRRSLDRVESPRKMPASGSA